MFLLLATLGAICCFVGFILFVVAGFRVSVIWGLIALFLPFLLSFGGNIVGAMVGLSDAPWWFWLTQLLFFLPWILLMALHWDKAKNGFMMYLAGVVFFAAAIVSIDAQSKQKIAVALQATGQPIPPTLADWLGIKQAGGPNDKAGAAGSASAAPGSPGATPGKPPADSATLPVAVAAGGGLETQEQVLAAVAELNDRAAKLKARKDMLKGSPDQLALTQLKEDINAFNDRLKAVTAREVELRMIPAPTPTPPPAPAIPTTVVIPQATPAPPPPAKKK